MFFQTGVVRAGCILGLFLAVGVGPVLGADWQVLPDHVPAVTRRLQAIGTLPATNELRLAMGLPLRDEAGLDRFLAEVYDPHSPRFRRFLTPEEFTTRFGPSEQSYAAVKEFAQTNGFTIVATHGNRLLLEVRARAADVQRAFHINLRKFRHPRESRDFFAPDAEPMVAATLPVLDVSGLSDYSRPQPRVRKVATQAVAPKNGSAPDGYSYLGQDFRNAYAPGTTLTGAGQQVGLVQFDGFNSNDIIAYENLLPGSPRVPLTTVLLDGFNGSPGVNNLEVCLDIEMAIAMAPGLSRIIVFEGSLPNSILNAMAASNTVKNLSCSWGWTGGPNKTTELIFKTLAAQGQSFFNATGDDDAFLPGQVDDPFQTTYPSGSPNITQVGGTTLTMNGTGAAYASETVWNRGNGTGSGGGISRSNAIPVWQQGLSMVANHGSTSFRNVPDVALTAENIYVCYGSGKTISVGGTSCAAPLWAGFMALVNERAAAAGNPPAGFINPAIYALGQGTNYHLYFHDTTSGNNFWASSPTNFPAVAGYDLCTGWGTPTGANLINQLATPNSLLVLPATGFTASGPVGGPFSIMGQTLVLTNISSALIDWALGGSADWLAISATGGSLAAGGKTNIQVSLAAGVESRAAGVYTADLAVSNLTSSLVQRVPFTLQIGQSLVQNGGFETGDFTAWTLVGNTVNGHITYNSVEDSSVYPAVIHSGNYGVFLGDIQLATLTQPLPTVPGQSYLLSFWLNNIVSGSVQIFRVSWNTNSPASNIVYNLLSPPVLAWTNLQFVLTATGTNTVLQFAAQNDPKYFGLDDVSVTPIPAPSFTAVSKRTNAIAFSWNSLAGLRYQIQSSTNLATTNWTALDTIQATAAISSYTNPVGSGRQQFFRIQRVP